MKNHFNGAMENRPKPMAIIVEEQLAYAMEYKAWKASGNKEGNANDPSKIHGVKCMSILFILSY
jgi:hypothetical protein